jgi:hypothetical protein
LLVDRVDPIRREHDTVTVGELEHALCPNNNWPTFLQIERAPGALCLHAEKGQDGEPVPEAVNWLKALRDRIFAQALPVSVIPSIRPPHHALLNLIT